MSGDETGVSIHRLYQLLFFYCPESESSVKEAIAIVGAGMNELINPRFSSRPLLDIVVNAEHIPYEIIVFMIRHGATLSKDYNLTAQCKERIKLLVAAGILHNKNCFVHPYMHQGHIETRLDLHQAEISKIAFDAIKTRAVEVCIALQDMDLDANRLMKIVFYDCLPFTRNVPKHLLWKLVTTVKHFK